MIEKPTTTAATLLTGLVQAAETTKTPVIDEIEWGDFLASVPPGQTRMVKNATHVEDPGIWMVSEPELFLYCDSEVCSDYRFFTVTEPAQQLRKDMDLFLRYACKNCDTQSKTIALHLEKKNNKYHALKIGEFSFFGDPIQEDTLKFFDNDKDIYRKGHWCEEQDFGIAAFTYYRRVLENQKIKIFNKVIAVAKLSNSNKELISELEEAKKEKQFTNAIDKIKHAIPDSLLINGANPLLLLYAALSDGIHGLSDQECLELSQNIRTVLDEFVIRANTILDNNDEVIAAVNKLKARYDAKKAKS